MAIGILYESQEWSSFALLDKILEQGVAAELVDLRQDVDMDKLLSYDLIVNRVFASSVFRDNHRALEQMPRVLEALERADIPIINPAKAHWYEISKALSTKALAEGGFPVPQVYGVFLPREMEQADTLHFPCVIKPDCGGRTNYTFILHSRQELAAALQNVPEIPLIAQEYIPTQYGFLTRIEVIDRQCKLVLKRSVAENGLSAYHLGSTYQFYPECSPVVLQAAVSAMDLLCIECGSLDIIENDNGFFIIDVNSVSNASEDTIEMFRFDLMGEIAAYVVNQYNQMMDIPD